MATDNSTHATKRAGLRMLSKGIASPADVAELAKVSRQAVNHWINDAGINWRKAREQYLADHWRRALR